MPKHITYTKNEVHTIAIANKILFWVRMYDVQEVLRIKNISDLVRKEIHGIFETKIPSKGQIRKHKKPGKNGFIVDIYTYVSNHPTVKIIKTCRGVTGRGDKNR